MRRLNNHQEVEYCEEGSENCCRKLGKNMGIRSVRRGIRKWRPKATQGREKGPKNLNFF